MKLLLAFFVLMLFSCGNVNTKYEENLVIQVETSRFFPVMVDSLHVTLVEDGTELLDTVIACDTVAQFCNLPDVNHGSSQDWGWITINAEFYSNSISVGALSRNIQSTDQGNLESPLSYKLDSAAMVVAFIRKNECKSGSENCITDPRNGGQNYRIARIGTQIWMAENLNVPVNSDSVSRAWSDCYNYDPFQCALRGRLYNWYALFDGTIAPGVQGICPSGWHLPTDAEWNVLEVFAGLPVADTIISADWRGNHASHLRLKSNLWGLGWETMIADNSTGFSAFPGGVYDGFGSKSFFDFEEDASYWTSTEVSTSESGIYDQAIKRKIGLAQEGVRRDPHHKMNGYSLRCVKD